MWMPEEHIARRNPIKHEVYDFLHQNILAGEYAAGSWLRQEEIASRLGVSMTPVREALDMLVSSGLAERVPYRGVRIIKPATPDILNSYSMRLLLESSASYAAAINISSQELAGLHELLDRAKGLVALSDLPQERALSRELHSAIVFAAGNGLLHKMYLTVLNTFPDWLLYEHLYRKPELLEESMCSENREHALIVEALDIHDPDLAMQRTIEHLRNRGRELQIYLGIAPEQIEEHESCILALFGINPFSDTHTEKELL
jgi:DNA-binding GntR family transcriptional regulator